MMGTQMDTPRAHQGHTEGTLQKKHKQGLTTKKEPNKMPAAPELDSFFNDRGTWVRRFCPSGFQSLNLNDIEPRGDCQTEALAALRQYSADVVQRGRRTPCVLYGAPGSGKTMFAAALWNELAAQVNDRSVLKDVRNAGTADNIVWVRGDRLVSDYWKPVGEPVDKRTQEQRQHHLVTARLAVLDDCDKHPSGGWSSSLFGLLDARCCHYHVPTIITMNTTPAEFAKRYENGDAMVDRLRRMGGLFIRLDKEGGPH